MPAPTASPRTATSSSCPSSLAATTSGSSWADYADNLLILDSSLRNVRVNTKPVDSETSQGCNAVTKRGAGRRQTAGRRHVEADGLWTRFARDDRLSETPLRPTFVGEAGMRMPAGAGRCPSCTHGGETLTAALRSRPRAMSLALVLVLMAGLLVAFASAAQAQVEDTGASATKVCAPAVAPDFYTIGETVPCVALFANTGATQRHGDRHDGHCSVHRAQQPR